MTRRERFAPQATQISMLMLNGLRQEYDQTGWYSSWCQTEVLPETEFAAFSRGSQAAGTYEFVVDDRGVVTQLLAHGVAGSPRAVRRR